MSDTSPKIVRRSQRVAFMDTDETGSTPKFERMTNFTTMTNSKNPKEYSRQYVDEDTERSDVVGYAPSIEFSYDRHTNTPVHDKLSKIHDKELLGNDTHVDIISVDLFSDDGKGNCLATKRTYAVIPDTDGNGTDAMIYSGTFKSVSEIEEGYATSEDGWKTATYTKGAIPEA
ncbi:hypothetical protein EAI28_22900 [Faecalicatena contorta]|uniref:hypothetical protein n=1 Tax=Faecalicatena contorta TaxID=39482 RepID=UPI00129E11F0|nr:hypothetical protein [Faecalicatena contorta]MRM91177.1 hypothetical protein [Faecalicatena contorta]